MHLLHLILVIIRVKFNQKKKQIIQAVTDMNDENVWKKLENNLHLVKKRNSPATSDDRTNIYFLV